MKRIGIIGLGIMGHGIALNFLKAGYAVTVWNRTADKAIDLVSDKLVVANTPREVAEKSDIVFEVTADDESSRKVWLGEDGILEGSSPEQYLITCATLTIDWVNELAEVCSKKQVVFFDMPMTGSRPGAESGQLVLMVGGEQKKLNEINQELKAITKQVKYFGPVNSGTKYKLILNSLQAIHMLGFYEALQMAKEAGLDENLVGDSLSEIPGGTTTNFAWKNYKDEPKLINFSIGLIAKDLNYAEQMAKSGQYPLRDKAQAKFNAGAKSGHSADDWTKISKF